MQKQSQYGQLLVELLLTIALAAVLIPAIGFAVFSSYQGKALQLKKNAAVALLQQSSEALRSVRERGWSNLSQNGTYHSVASGSAWFLLPGTHTENDMTESIIISDVFRDSSGAISSSGILDPSTKKADIVISWLSPNSSFVQATVYLTRFLDTLSYTESTEAQFNQGVLSSTTVASTNGGEVVLSGGGHGDWCNPASFVVGNLDLPQSAAARDVKAVEGKAFTGTSQSGTGSFVKINISNTDPPVPTIASTISGYQTNDVFIDGNYAYVATNDINRDVVIIDLTTNQQVGYFDDDYLFGTAQGVYVVGNVGYVTIGFRLHTFDLSSKNGERPELDSVVLGFLATGRRFMVVGNYAYVSLNIGLSEMRLVNVANPNNIRLGAKADVNGEEGQEVYVNSTGTRAYLVTGESSSRSEFFIINTNYSASQKDSTSFSLSVLGSYNTSGMSPTGVTVVAGNRAIIVGTGGEEYQVLDIGNESSPIRCGGMQVNSGIYGVSSVLEQDGDAYSYIVTGDSSSEFKIIEGGPGGSQYADSGTFESQIFDVGSSAAFYRAGATVTKPSGTDITYQVAVADKVGGACINGTYVYVGPDGTSSTFFQTEGTIPMSDDAADYENPGSCFRYKAYLSTTDSSKTPILHDMTVYYSP